MLIFSLIQGRFVGKSYVNLFFRRWKRNLIIRNEEITIEISSIVDSSRLKWKKHTANEL